MARSEIEHLHTLIIRLRDHARQNRTQAVFRLASRCKSLKREEQLSGGDFQRKDSGNTIARSSGRKGCRGEARRDLVGARSERARAVTPYKIKLCFFLASPLRRIWPFWFGYFRVFRFKLGAGVLNLLLSCGHYQLTVNEPPNCRPIMPVFISITMV